MDTNDLIKFIQNDPFLQGVNVCSYDKIGGGNMYIVNTLASNSTEQVGHWVCYCIVNQQRILFDSVTGVAHALIPHDRCNAHPVQESGSRSCGYFCLYFYCALMRGVSWENIFSSFQPDNFSYNETLVYSFLLSL